MFAHKTEKKRFVKVNEAVAVGTFAIGKLHIGRAKIKRLHFGTLIVDELVIRNRSSE